MFFCELLETLISGDLLETYRIFSCLNCIRGQYIIQVGRTICCKAEASCFHDTCNFRSEFITFCGAKKVD